MYNLIAKPLQFFYELWPNYAGAVSLLTLTIMILLLPLTLKGTRSMLAMQKLSPEMKKLQAKYKDDRQKLNEEMMLFYKENNISPVSGCTSANTGVHPAMRITSLAPTKVMGLVMISAPSSTSRSLRARWSAAVPDETATACGAPTAAAAAR